MIWIKWIKQSINRSFVISTLLYSQASEFNWYWKCHIYITLNSKSIEICTNEAHKFSWLHEPTRSHTRWCCVVSTTQVRTANISMSTQHIKLNKLGAFNIVYWMTFIFHAIVLCIQVNFQLIANLVLMLLHVSAVNCSHSQGAKSF